MVHVSRIRGCFPRYVRRLNTDVDQDRGFYAVQDWIKHEWVPLRVPLERIACVEGLRRVRVGVAAHEWMCESFASLDVSYRTHLCIWKEYSLHRPEGVEMTQRSLVKYRR